MSFKATLYRVAALALVIPLLVAHASEGYPHPKDNPDSSLMLQGPWVPENSQEINFSTLPRIPSQLVTVSDARPRNGVHQHNYLAFFEGQY